VSPLLVLQARAEARALLFMAGDYGDCGEAVAPLLAYAQKSGLEENIGADVVMEIIRAAFKGIAEL